MRLSGCFREEPNRWISWYSSEPHGAAWVEGVFRVDDRVAGRPWFAVPYSEPGGVTDDDMRHRWRTWPYPVPLTDAQALGLLDLVRRRSPGVLPPGAGAVAFAAEGLECVFVRRADRPDLDRAWLTTDVLALARGVAVGRSFGTLPILADALQDAGCGAVGLLAHCRGPGPHVRGCWVVDLVLDKR